MQHIQTYEVFKRTMMQQNVSTLSLNTDVSDMPKLGPDVVYRKMGPHKHCSPHRHPDTALSAP